MNAHARFRETSDAPQERGPRRRVRRRPPVLSPGTGLALLNLALLIAAGVAVEAQFAANRLEEAPQIAPTLPAGWVWAWLGGAPMLFALHRTTFWHGGWRPARALQVALTACWVVAAFAMACILAI
jgi:hypothetical protein